MDDFYCCKLNWKLSPYYWSSRSTNVIGLVVNIKGAKGFFFPPNYLVFRDHDLASGFAQPYLVNGPNDGYYIQKEVRTSFNNQFISDMAHIQMFNFSYVDSSTIHAIKK